MCDTSSTFGAYAAAELIAAKAAGRHFKQGELAAFLDILLHDWQQRGPQVLATTEPTKIDAEAIYQAYPRKVGKKAALKAIANALAEMLRTENYTPTRFETEKESAAAHLLGITKSYASHVATWPARDREFIPHPSTWFNRGSYLDDPREWQAKGARTTTDTPRDYSHV